MTTSGTTHAGTDPASASLARSATPAQAGPPDDMPRITGETGEVVVRRTAQGWQVEGDPHATGDPLLDAMALADLLAADLPPPERPQRCADDVDEVERLRVTISQLEHALAARVVVEQAIGVLTERLHTSPRSAFERLRKAARSRGRRVHQLAREVVDSSTDRAVPLPPELHGPR